jgi:hypothetical protein
MVHCDIAWENAMLHVARQGAADRRYALRHAQRGTVDTGIAQLVH